MGNKGSILVVVIMCAVAMMLAYRKVSSEKVNFVTSYNNLAVSDSTLQIRPEIKDSTLIFAPECTSCSQAKFINPKKLPANYYLVYRDTKSRDEWSQFGEVFDYNEFRLDPDIPIPAPSIMKIRSGKVVFYSDNPKIAWKEVE